MCQDKTEVIVFVEEEEKLKASAQLQSVKLRTTNQTKNLGVVMDSIWTATLRQIQSQPTITWRTYWGLKDVHLSGIWKKLVHVFIFSQLYYCNGVFAGLSKNIYQATAVDSEFCLIFSFSILTIFNLYLNAFRCFILLVCTFYVLWEALSIALLLKCAIQLNLPRLVLPRVSSYCDSRGWKRIYNKHRDDFKLKWCEIKSAANYCNFREGSLII